MTVRRSATLAALLFLLTSPAAAQDIPVGVTRYASSLRFRTISTPRFDIHFHQREEGLARRLAAMVETVAAEVEARLGRPRQRVQVILVDQSDVSNGWATVIPYNMIEIRAVPPPARSSIGNTDDWLRLAFAHEYAHVVHLEKSSGWFGSLRHVFGRVPAFYSNLFLPAWQIEGFATVEESALTGQGRVPAGDFRMLLEGAAAAERFAPLDRAVGTVIDWPGGTSAYLYGAYFHQFLAEKYGAETLARLADDTASRLPFVGSPAYKQVYGQSLGELWKAFADDTAAKLRSDGPERRRRLTSHGFLVSGPAFSADGRLFYSIANPHGFPSLMELADGRARTIGSRYYGDRLTFAGQTLVFDQLEVTSHVELTSDLYRRSLVDGDTRRLTRGARAADPDLSPDGRTLICTVQEAGRRVLATIDMSSGGATVTPVTFIAEEATEFSWPRWSPDGRSIAAERRRLQGPSELVVIDASTRQIRTVVSSAEARNVTPSWLPDGRGIVFASDRSHRPFTLYTVDVPSLEVRRISGAGIGAHAPAISPDGRRLVFVGYSADGYDLYEIPFEPTQSEADDGRADAGEQPGFTRSASEWTSADADASRPYSPFHTLTPRFWIPFVESDGDDTVLGAGTGGFDALGRHTYAVTAGWAVPSNRADMRVEYSYTRFRPALFASYSDDSDAWREGHIRTREAVLGALLPLRYVRWSAAAFVGLSGSEDVFERSSDAFPNRPRQRRASLRTGLSVTNAKSYGYSISAEEGASLGFVWELARGAGGSEGDASTVIGEARAYLRARPRHAVIAARVAGAVSRGDTVLKRTFTAAGEGPQGGPFDVGLGAIGLLRGFDETESAGTNAAVANVDFRFPLWWPQRGFGTWPVFLRALHGAIFIDAGHAWNRTFRSQDIRASAGLELSFDTVLANWLPFGITAGAAWRHDPFDSQRGLAGFVRLGRAF